ncbi:uncharacterized protein N7498_009323 [Penicillium cinerascens]|uniref:Myb-like domain-containing protein n=1 Tax=Penicillium cinerascens TaxID=70096 RepID=A0A9W9J5A5_9EURO|nr:uncharacterized protein N7498_009323 [Penicillium cinerascens]KAJ5190338.1 hypothetical protein N7498_009323 [Penicillium cinerascens]
MNAAQGQGQVPDYKKRVGSLDFVSRSEDRIYGDQAALRAKVQLVTETLQRYHPIFNEGKSFARHRSGLFSNTYASALEAKIRKNFDNRDPVGADPESSANSENESPNWSGMIRGTKEEHFQRVGGNESYQFRAQGHLIRVSGKERGYILRFPQDLLEPWPHEQDIGQEKQSILAGIGDMRMLTDDVEKLIKHKDQFISELEKRYYDICQYEADLSRPPESELVSVQPQIREPSLANSILVDARGDIDYGVPEEVGNTVADPSTQADTHEDTAGDAIQNNSTTGTASGTPPREIGNDMQAGARRDPSTRNAKRSNEGQDYGFTGTNFDYFNSSDSDEWMPDAPTTSLGRKRRRKSERGPYKSGEEKKHFFKFIGDRLDKDMGWVQIADEYNKEFGTNRSKSTLQGYHWREKAKRSKKGIQVRKYPFNHL